MAFKDPRLRIRARLARGTNLRCSLLFSSILFSLVSRVRVQNHKLDSEINAPFLLNEHGDPRFFCLVFAKNSLIKNMFEEGKKFDSRT